MSRLRSTLAIAFVVAACLAAAAPRAAPQDQPDPAPARVHVESVEVNLTQHPSFQFVVQVPTALKFEAGEVNGTRYLHIWAYSMVDSLDARIQKATNYIERQASIYTPFIEPPNRLAADESLRDFKPERRLSYNRRLT